MRRSHRAVLLFVTLARASSAALLVVFVLASNVRAKAIDPSWPNPSSTVGYPVDVRDVVLPGSELEPVPLDDESPVVVRIDAVHPHGTDHRYDLVVSGLEPGTFDLRDHLRRKDGGELGALPELTFVVESLLPAGHVEPNELESGSLPWYWEYRLLLCILVGIWSGGLIALWRLGRRRREVDEDEDIAQPVSLADRLRPLVADATAGRLDSARLAELERALIAFWRRRLVLDDVPATELMARLRAHPEAGPLLERLEVWLHHPSNAEETDPARRTREIGELLAPYADLPPDALDRSEALDPSEAISSGPGRQPSLGGGAR